MFEKLASTVKTTANTNKKGTMTHTTQFVTAIVQHNLRITYAALAQAAKILGENPSNQQLAQRGAGLVKKLPGSLQPHVCRRNGGYATGTSEKWAQAGIQWPEDLETRGLIKLEQVAQAVEAWRDAQEA